MPVKYIDSVIDLWRMSIERIESLSPDQTVYTMRLRGGDCDGLLCDMAWERPEDRRRHFWYTRPDWMISSHEGPVMVEPLEMPLKRYIRLHVNEVKGINPFYTAGRIEALANWNTIYGRDY